MSLDLAKARAKDPNWLEAVLASGGVNVLWDSPFTTQTATVPINQSGVERYIKNLWPGDVVCPLKEPVDFRILPDGSLERVSPEEPVQALVVHVARMGNPKR